MAEGAHHSAELEIGHVLTMDVVGYSNLLITEQTRIIADLTRVVRDAARFRRAEGESKFLRLPTGDGMALVFFGDPQAPIECAIEIATALKDNPQILLRMGVHSGPVNQVTDVNDRSNVAGAGIDMAQRVMDCGDVGHILLSKRVAEDLAPFPRWNPHLHDLGECEVKHGRKISVVNFFTDTIGNPEPPRKFRPHEVQAPARSVPTAPPSRRKFALLAGAILLLIALAIAAFILFSRRVVPIASTSTSPAPAQINRKSIAVLPFENLSHEPDNAYFADGIQEEILTRLSKVADLKVISRSSTLRYKSAPGDVRTIADQLGVAHILEGSVQKSGDQVRVNVQLINAENYSHLWAEKFDRTLTDIFAVESEIAAKIADILQAKLSGTEQRAIAARPTENSKAHELYLRGLFYWNKGIGPDFEKAGAYYQQAIALDPTYALAYAGLADYYGFAFANGLLPTEEKWAKAEEDYARKALELDPTLGEAYNPLAAAKLYYRRDWPGAERDFHRGFELSPNFPEMHHHYALCLILFGRNDEAFAESRRALELDPLSPRFGLTQGQFLFFTRQYDAAIEQYRKTLELDPNFAPVHEWLGYAYEKKQMQKEAVAEWSKALSLTRADQDAALLERTYASSGFQAAVRALAQSQLERLKEKSARGEYVAAVEYVICNIRAGDQEEAFTWLAKAAEERNRLALEIKVNPLFDPLRSDPRFDKIVNAILPSLTGSR